MAMINQSVLKAGPLILVTATAVLQLATVWVLSRAANHHVQLLTGLVAITLAISIEALCYPEMLAMGYKPSLKAEDCAHVIASVQEETHGLRTSYLHDYALSKAERRRELARWSEISTGNAPGAPHGLSILDGVQYQLIAAIRAGADVDE